MSERKIPYERPTCELRQVKNTVEVHGYPISSYKTQQKWQVQTGPVIEDWPEAGFRMLHHTDIVLSYDEVLMFGLWFPHGSPVPPMFRMRAREEWRDLPVVEAETNKGAE